ncbi:E3 ubiquitin-protein ligase RSL1-like [Mercurialis annua]|uniref:E3 ubiquitin-protein ligase RSL1-like n=1 Tax=Mercurialis annua TaxID=3986 RepID=UPI00215FBF3B|nr:E3 ubiquitin-protein ligase RSL1-like [Mercurialis annua]
MTNPNAKRKMSVSSNVDDQNDDVDDILKEQRREITEAKALFSDNDLAFNLQMEEAITASISLNPNVIPSPTLNDAVLHEDDDFDYTALLLDDVERLDQERRDREACENLMREMKKELDCRIHDQKVASEISNIPDVEWEKYGDNFEKPYVSSAAAGSSSSNGGELGLVNGEGFKVYCKGVVSEEMIREMKVVVGGIGVAICDFKDNVIFEVSKAAEVGLVKSAQGVVILEIKAIIEGLNAALSLELSRITFYCDDFMIYQYLTGRVQPSENMIATLVDQVSHLLKEFTDCQPMLVTRNDIKFAFKLARNAVVSQITWNAEPDKGKKSLKETCMICFEDKDVGQMFSVDGCLHRYCFPCMKQHVEVKLLNGMEANCPHESCQSEVSIEDCGQFLDPKLVNIISQRKKEAAIAVTEKVYCPQMRCSALMSKSECLEYTKGFFVGADKSGARKCMKCKLFFCLSCQVPWHYNVTCSDYRRSNPYARAEDAMLDSLAKQKLWRRCMMCNHIIELAQGCYHITCRCGYEFCYTCGAPWKNKKATCRCRIWDERNIIYARR